MLSGTIKFPLGEWTAACPPGLIKLSPYLIELNKENQTLKQLLDCLIALIYQCELHNKKELRSEERRYLNEILKKSYQLASIICDQPNITFDELWTIAAKRRIDPSYLPKHLPGQDPPFIRSEKNPLLEEQVLRKAVLTPEERKIRKKYRQERLLKFLPLLWRKKPKNGTNQEQILPELIYKEDSEFLAIATDYYLNETLPKAINEKSYLKLPALENLATYFAKFDDCLALIDDFKIEEKTALKIELQTIIAEQRQSILDHQKELTKYGQKARFILAAHILQVTRRRLLDSINDFDKGHDLNSATLKSAVNKAAGEFNPQLLAQYNYFKAKNPELFHQSNEQLQVNYFNEIEREPYRLHLYDGKFYQFDKVERDGGRLHFSPVDTLNHCSHEKEGWIAFIMNTRGEIFATSHFSTIMHSSFMAGAPVIFAGEMKIENGRLQAVTNYSGHYRPQFKHLENFARHLKSRGVDTANVDFVKIKSKVINTKLNEVRSSSHRLSQEKIKKLENEIWRQSGRLKFSTRYRFKGDQLVKAINYAKIFQLVLLSVALALSLTLLIGLSVASSGITVPLFSLFLVSLANTMSTSIGAASGIAITTSAGLTALSSFFTAKVIGLDFLKNKIGNFFTNLFGKKVANIPEQKPQTILERPSTFALVNSATSAPGRLPEKGLEKTDKITKEATTEFNEFQTNMDVTISNPQLLPFDFLSDQHLKKHTIQETQNLENEQVRPAISLPT